MFNTNRNNFSDNWDNYYMDEFVRTPEVVKHPGFSILARSDVSIQEAMNRQGLTLESLAAIAGPQISSRQSFVGSLASTLSSVGGVRIFNGSLILLSLNLCIVSIPKYLYQYLLICDEIDYRLNHLSAWDLEPLVHWPQLCRQAKFQH